MNYGTLVHGGQTYKTLQVKDSVGNPYTFMCKNLNFDTGSGCCYYNNDASNAARYGRMYTWDAAQRACPEGWDIIDFPRWEQVLNIRRASDYHKFIEGGSSGLNFNYGGRKQVNINRFMDQGTFGFYWSKNDQPNGKGELYIFDSGGQVITNLWKKDNVMLSARAFRTDF